MSRTKARIGEFDPTSNLLVSTFNDYLCYSSHRNDPTNDSSIATPPQMRSLGMGYPIGNYVSCEKFHCIS